MTTILSANGLVEIPEEFREADALRPGQHCEIERLGRGDYRIRVGVPESVKSRERLIDVLRSCPVKDWWVESDRDEYTTLTPPTLFQE